MNVDYINPVLSSLLNVLTTMAQMQPVPGKPRLKEGSQAMGEVTGLMNMESRQARGSLAITFPEVVILEINRRMVGEDKQAVDDMVVDLAGEITNMVVGGAKNLLLEKGYDFEMSLPTVYSGHNHEVRHLVEAPVLVLPVRTDAGDFYIEICFDR